MEALKEKIPTYVKYLKDELIPGVLHDYKIVEDEKIICFFSKFSIDINEIYEIFQFVETLKLNIFKSMIKQFQECAQNLVTFQDNGLSEKDKLIYIFSACFYHYYMSFSYDINNKFEDYFNIEFFKKCESFKFSIKSVTNFQIFALNFYNHMKSHIKLLDYEKIKKYYKFYNPSIAKVKEPQKFNFGQLGSINFFSNKFATKLMSAKQKLIDMVFEIKTKSDLDNYPNDANFIATSLEKMNKMSKDFYLNSSSNTQPESLNTQNKVSFFTKRVLSEIVKYDLDNSTKSIVDEVSKKIEEEYLDEYLNSHRDLEYQVMSYFICYRIDFNSDFIKTVSGNNNISNNLSIRLIVPVKELYNMVMELFFTVSNLSFITVDHFAEVAVKRGIQMKYATFLYLYVKGFMKLCVEETNVHQKIVDILKKFDENTFLSWERALKKRVEEVTSHCSF